jgi:hypothetical protein
MNKVRLAKLLRALPVVVAMIPASSANAYEVNALEVADQLRAAFASSQTSAAQELIQLMSNCGVSGLQIGGQFVSLGDLPALASALSAGGPVWFDMGSYLTSFCAVAEPATETFVASSSAVAE